MFCLIFHDLKRIREFKVFLRQKMYFSLNSPFSSRIEKIYQSNVKITGKPDLKQYFFFKLLGYFGICVALLFLTCLKMAFSASLFFPKHKKIFESEIKSAWNSSVKEPACLQITQKKFPIIMVLRQIAAWIFYFSRQISFRKFSFFQ